MVICTHEEMLKQYRKPEKLLFSSQFSSHLQLSRASPMHPFQAQWLLLWSGRPLFSCSVLCT